MIAILTFLSVMTNNQTKCGIIYEKITIRAGDDGQMINHEWSNFENISHFVLVFLLLTLNK